MYITYAAYSQPKYYISRYYKKYYSSQSYDPPAFLIFSQNQVLHILRSLFSSRAHVGLTCLLCLYMQTKQAYKFRKINRHLDRIIHAAGFVYRERERNTTILCTITCTQVGDTTDYTLCAEVQNKLKFLLHMECLVLF